MSPASQEFPVRPLSEPDALHNGVPYDVSAPVLKLHKALSFQFQKQRWPVLGGMFGNSDKNQLPPELHSSLQSHNNTASLKQMQSSSTESRLLPEVPSTTATAPPLIDPEKVKKEAARMAREAKKQQRAQMEKAQQEQSRAVMQNSTSSSWNHKQHNCLSGRVCKHNCCWVPSCARPTHSLSFSLPFLCSSQCLAGE